MDDSQDAIKPSGGTDETLSGEIGGVRRALANDLWLEVEECDLTGNVKQTWRHNAAQTPILVLPPEQSDSSFAHYVRRWRQVVSDTFMPAGFPNSVSGDYLAYQVCDSLQASFSSITSILSKRALFTAAGVGDAKSSATAVAIMDKYQNLLSNGATIGFANRFGLRVQPDVKRYRFLADLLNDTAFLLDLAGPFVGPNAKIVVLSVANALRALCSVAGDASKATLSAHFAKQNNLSDIATKEKAQETAVELTTTFISAMVASYVEKPWSVFCLTIVLVLAHLLVNYLGVCFVVLDTLNRQRAILVFEEYFKSGKVLSPRETAERENILLYSSTLRNRHGFEVARMSVVENYKQAFRNISANILSVDQRFFSLHIDQRSANKMIIDIILYEGSQADDIITAWYTGMLIAYNTDHVSLDAEKSASASVLREGFQKKEELFSKMRGVGWNLSKGEDFETGVPMRVRFRSERKKDE